MRLKFLLKKKAVEEFGEFVERFPKSNLADDAMFAKGCILRDINILRDTLNLYPNSDIKKKIRKAIRKLR